MGKVAVRNTGKVPMYVNGTMIPPGEYRHIEEHEVPSHLREKRPEPPPEVPRDPLAELAAKGVKQIVEALPGLSDEDLTRLGDLEQQRGKDARKGVLSAVSEDMLLRAEIAETLAAGEATITRDLRGIATGDLPRYRDAEANGQHRAGVIAALNAELVARKRKEN